MAVAVWQHFEETITADLLEPQDDQMWCASGSEITGDIIDALAATIPATYRGLYLHNYTPTHKGAGFWEVRVHYGRAVPMYPNIIRFNGQTTGFTIHREQSLQTVATYFDPAIFPAGDPPDFKGLIGVTDDNVAGVDVVEPHFAFKLTKRFSVNLIPFDFLDNLIGSGGTVNNVPIVINWKGQIIICDAGELLFRGAVISDAGRDPDANELIDVEYDLERSPNKDQLIIGNIQPIFKYGWDYLWLRVKRTNDGTNITKKPVAAYIEQVYEYDDFTTLGL